MLSPAQLTTLRTAVLAEATLASARNSGDDAAIAAWLNALANPTYYVWRSTFSTQDVFDSVVWANLTPNDPADGTQLWLNRAMACQAKQFNLQTMLTGRESINPTKPNVRQGLQDALTAIPSGVSGANRSAGWTALQLAMSRLATRAENLLATGTGSQPSPALMAFEGLVSGDEASQMR